METKHPKMRAIISTSLDAEEAQAVYDAAARGRVSVARFTHDVLVKFLEQTPPREANGAAQPEAAVAVGADER